ncbi:MAG TPA: terminase family protein, partial [Terriglobales bacterium]|nr:terminase family protein [Terriglobales bacterium]
MAVLDASPAESAVLLAELRQRWAARRLDVPAPRPLRPAQRTPDGDWRTWLILAGRGWGKTLTGASDVAAYGLAHPGARVAVVGRTFADARDTCVEGETGLLSVLPGSAVAAWNRSLGQLMLANGARYHCFSADQPDRLRGPQHHRAWCDELAAWAYPDAWDQLMFGLRLGADPRVVVTTTPRPSRLVRTLTEAPTTHLTRGTTYENVDNLPAAFMDQIVARYEGTRLARQEILGEIVLDVPGALWTWAMLEDRRPPPADPVRCVVAVDPAVSSSEESDETGILVCALGADGRGYVLADRSCRLSPDGWARRVVQAFDDFEADLVVAEVNNGGDLVSSVLRTVRPGIPFKAVHASRGKVIRAQPVAALYEQGRVSHCDVFAELEEQLTTWTPESGTSPDRLD